MENQTKTTSNVLSEKPQWVKVGYLWFKVRPVTLSQLWELGAFISDKEQMELEGEIQPVVEMLNHYDNLKVCTEAVLIIMFRNEWKRKLWRRYISHHLNMAEYQTILEYSAMTFHAGFFLTSFTFLKGAKEMTTSTNTDSAIARGDSWVES